MSQDTALVVEDIVPVVEDKAAVKKVQMENVRNAKKRKQSERDDILTDMKKQIYDLTSLMSRSSDTSVSKTDNSSDNTSESDKPTVVTRDDVQEELPLSEPSLKTEVFRSLIVAGLGCGTWYFSNVWSKKHKKEETVITSKPDTVVKQKSFINQPSTFTMPTLPTKKTKILGCGLSS
jgi:hypothetical protein